MKMRRMLATFLSLVMVMSLVTGCGSSENEGTTAKTNTDVTTTVEDTTTDKENVTTELSSDEETSRELESSEEASKDEETTKDDTTVEDVTTKEEETTKVSEKDTTTKKQEVTTTKKQEVTTTKKQEVTTTKKQEVTTTKKQEVTTIKKQEVTTTKKQEVTTTKKQETTTTKKQETTTTKKQETTTTKKQEIPTQEELTTVPIDIDDPPITNDYDGYYLNQEQVLAAYKSGDISELCANDRAVYKVVVPLINGIKATYDTDFEREKAVHDWLVLNASYDYDKFEADTLDSWDFHPYGVFVMKTGVCQSYAEAFDLCMAMLDIECDIVTGTANGGGHAWNAVKLDGEWYQVDVTWDDPVPDVPGKVIYTYFNVTDAVMKKDHTYTYDKSCNGTKYNYENMLNQQYMAFDNYKGSLDAYYAYINERVAAGDIEVEVYVTTDYDTYHTYQDYTKIDYSTSPHRPNLVSYGFKVPEIMTSSIWKMTFYFELK